MAEIGDWFNQLPPITRYWFGASLAFPLLGRFNFLSPYYLILTSDFVKNFQLWKPLTAVLYYPVNAQTGFHYLTNLYFLVNYSKRLEMGYFSNSRADYFFMVFFNWICLVALGLVLGFMLLMDPMVMSVLYVYCMINQDQIVSFWFGTRFKARYLPWVLFGMNFILGGGGMSDLVGILVGHLYYFITMKYPRDSGVTLIQTPQFLRNYFQNNQPRIYMAPERRGPSQNPAPPTGHDWGRGRRLED